MQSLDDSCIIESEESDSFEHGKLYNDIEEMMFGFGDEWPPDSNSVKLVEEITIKYIEDLALRALHYANSRGKLDKDCFMYLIRKDRRKFTRIQTLMKANEELKRAKTLAECDLSDSDLTK
jgi:transcription initiation factor TFIID subunit 13